MTFDAFDVVIVPFPFTDGPQSKRRPALVLSSKGGFGSQIEQSVMAMITSAANAGWPLDVPIADRAIAGLTADCVVRMKLFTLDHRFVLGRAGHLASADRRKATEALQKLFADAFVETEP